MYGFSVSLSLKSDLPFREVWRAIEEMGDFFRPTGAYLHGQELGSSEPGFLGPLIAGERVDEGAGLTVLEAPVLKLPEAPHPAPQTAWGGHLRGTVLLRARDGAPRLFYREWQDGKPLRLLLLNAIDHDTGHLVGFWTESHVWLSQSPRNPIREFADENLLSLGMRVDSFARRFEPHLISIMSNFNELKGPFGEEKDRLARAFDLLPKFEG
jgi:hypothetical protein